MKLFVCVVLLFSLVSFSVSAVSFDMSTEYSVNSSALNYFRSVLAGLPAGLNYIIFQSSRYETVLIYGELTVNGTVVTCSDGYRIVYDSSYYADDRRYLSFSEADGDTVTAVSGLIYYTNLQVGNAPNASISEYSDVQTAQLISNILVVLIFGLFIYVAFKFIRRRWVQSW